MFFFFKQKTAYEMRISDWSSDVCSSDLSSLMPNRSSSSEAPRRLSQVVTASVRIADFDAPGFAASASRRSLTGLGRKGWWRILSTMVRDPAADRRSEEHTSELRSLMRISYAVFCLKTKKNNNRRL